MHLGQLGRAVEYGTDLSGLRGRTVSPEGIPREKTRHAERHHKKQSDVVVAIHVYCSSKTDLYCFLRSLLSQIYCLINCNGSAVQLLICVEVFISAIGPIPDWRSQIDSKLNLMMVTKCRMLYPFHFCRPLAGLLFTKLLMPSLLSKAVFISNFSHLWDMLCHIRAVFGPRRGTANCFGHGTYVAGTVT